MKKFLPLILLLAGVAVLLVVFFTIKGRSEKVEDLLPKEETALLDLPLAERPFVSLIPTPDGHYLNMKVEKIGFDAFSMDYLLEYPVPGGVPQGVPGSVNLEGKKEFEAELLLGSESSGKFRYDEGVEEGTLTFRFRDEDGQLLAKFETEFFLKSETALLSSPDGKFSYEFEKKQDSYFVIMNTIGLPATLPGEVMGGVYGVFSSDKSEFAGKAVIENSENIYRWADDRIKSETLDTDGKMPDIGIFTAITNISRD